MSSTEPATGATTGVRPAETEAIERDILGYLARHEQKELLRFTAVGSVDDGKSTLIGRLLHDTAGLYEDQLAAVRRASRTRPGHAGEGEEIDFSLFTDGLRAEREQGITIDVAYRYFSTEKRKFIIADTPGHVQYTRNMATGASTADVAIVLLDARLGVLPQSRRHAYIASLLGIQHLLVAVNKMDLVDYERALFERLSGEFGAFAERLGFESVRAFPISARRGDNVVRPSERTPWWEGGTLLGHLETVPIGRDHAAERLRFPVQYVLRPDLDYRAFAGQIAAGVLRRGDEVAVLPSGRRTRVKSIDTWEGALEQAAAPLSVAVRLEDEVDVSRGDLIARPDELPQATRRFEAMLVWMSERPFDPRRALLLKHTSRMVSARVERLQWRLDLETLARAPASGLVLNDIARVAIATTRPLFCDPYRACRGTGAFILVDALSNDTVGAGMIEEAEASATAERGPVGAAERAARLGQSGAAMFLDGGAALARALERRLFDRGLVTLVLDASELAPEALAPLVERTVDAGLAVIVAGAPAQAAEAIAARLGAERAPRVTGADAADVATLDRLAEDLAARCALADADG